MAKERKRLTKQEIREDEVAEFFFETAQYVKANAKKIAGIVLVVAVVSVVVLLSRQQGRAAEIEARQWVARANLELRQGNVVGALQSYSAVMDRYRGTWSHSDANFFAANANFVTGRYDSSMVLFERYLSLKKRRDVFTVSAKLGIAQCLEEMGRYREAAESYLKVQREHPDSPLAPEALVAAGRSYELAGDLRLAEDAYNEVLELYRDSNQAILVRMPLLEIQAKLESF